MAGEKRDPSSLVQFTITSGRSVRTEFSCRVRRTSSAPMTPRMPSNRPPLGWESMCEPLITGGKAVVPPGPPAEDVAHAVDGDRAVDLPQPGHEEIARPAVLVRECQALHAAARGRADLRHPLQGVPQAFAVHPQFSQFHVRPPRQGIWPMKNLTFRPPWKTG